jgi:hypothetical protein
MVCNFKKILLSSSKTSLQENPQWLSEFYTKLSGVASLGNLVPSDLVTEVTTFHHLLLDHPSFLALLSTS